MVMYEVHLVQRHVRMLSRFRVSAEIGFGMWQVGQYGCPLMMLAFMVSPSKSEPCVLGVP